jgi:hypothetical protein
MRYLRNKRRLAGLGALAAVIGLTLWLVFPALAGNASAGGTSQAGIVPTDVAVGGNGNCSNIFPHGLGTPVREYDNNNPKTSPKNKPYDSGNNDGVKFGLTLSTDSNRNQLLQFETSAGVSPEVLGVGVNGGTDTDAYDYTAVSPGYATTDSKLTAPAQSAGSYYSISHLTICYVVVTHVAGTVYVDGNSTTLADGMKNGSDASLAGATVRLYKDGAVVQTKVTDGNDPNYRFDVPVGSGTYRVCEQRPANPTSGHGYAESQPAPNSTGAADCSGTADQLNKGYDFDSSAGAVDHDDFGNADGILDTCGNFGLPGTYEIETATCKPTVPFVFTQPALSQPTVTVWTDTTANPTPIVEKLTFADPVDPATGQPKYKTLQYNDTFPFTGTYVPMPFCKFDPRDSAATQPDFTLQSDYSTVTPFGSATGSGAVLPTSTATSCAISVATIVDASGNYKLVAFVYSPIDGGRGIAG